jgi:hypothetical protein
MERNLKAEERCKLFLEKGYKVNDDGSIYSNIDKICEYINHNGYIVLSTRINGKKISLRSHHLVFYNTYGYVPEQINHINHNRIDNRIENLEPSNPFHNTQNYEIKGKCYNWHKQNKSWIVGRKFMNKRYYICYTKDEEEAKRLGLEVRKLKTLNEILEFKKNIQNNG